MNSKNKKVQALYASLIDRAFFNPFEILSIEVQDGEVWDFFVDDNVGIPFEEFLTRQQKFADIWSIDEITNDLSAPGKHYLLRVVEKIGYHNTFAYNLNHRQTFITQVDNRSFDKLKIYGVPAFETDENSRSVQTHSSVINVSF